VNGETAMAGAGTSRGNGQLQLMFTGVGILARGIDKVWLLCYTNV